MKPILFNTEMVKAILEGRKTVTRRVIKPQPSGALIYAVAGYGVGKWSDFTQIWTPPCHAGDILYIRETWAKVRYVKPKGALPADFEEVKYLYRADSEIVNGDGKPFEWKPSIHMPKDAARIFLLVKSVRVERLQDIDEDGAIKEGCAAGANVIAGGPWGVEDDPCEWTAREAFAELWDSTIKPADRDKYGWDANPWVWVIEFERCEKPEEV